jgi:transcriptional regulator with XRE-family HTH domain
MRLMSMNERKRPPVHLRTLGERLRYCRRQMGWTQEQLAVQAGTNQAVIQKIENGKSLRPRKIDQIAAVLEVNPAWLMFGDDKATPLTDDAREVAELWMGLPEHDRRRILEEIRRLAARNSRTQ